MSTEDKTHVFIQLKINKASYYQKRQQDTTALLIKIKIIPLPYPIKYLLATTFMDWPNPKMRRQILDRSFHFVKRYIIKI